MQTLSNKKLIITLIALVVVVSLVLFGILRDNSKTLNLDSYEDLLYSKKINQAIIMDDQIILKTDNKTYNINKNLVNIKKLWRYTPVTTYQRSYAWIYILVILTLLASILYINKLLKYIKTSNTQKSTDEKECHIKPSSSNVKFDDVAGIDNVKIELSEIVDFLHNSEKYKKFGLTLPRGILLIGPPGVGKTMLAKAIANEAKVPFYHENGASFVQIYAGMGAKRVKELFDAAKKNTPSIIFIDEIDAVGKSRGAGRSDEREATLNQLLSQIDGFEDSSGVIVIGATNKIDMIDSALLRPGRFDRRIFVDLPNINEREEILKIHLKNKKHNIDIKNIANLTSGFSGAALATITNEAGLNALKRGSTQIENEDFEKVKNKVILGKKNPPTLSPKEKEIQSYYYSTYAFCMHDFGFEFDKISMLDQKQTPNHTNIKSQKELQKELDIYLCGMVAIKLKYKEYYSNNKEDLKKAKNLAHKIVEEYGMGDKVTDTDADKLIQNSIYELKKLLSDTHIQDQIEEINKLLLQNEYVTFQQIKDIVEK